MSELLSVHHLTKRFKHLTAVDDISFKVAQGQCFGVLGPNGAGKTTAIEVIEGIVPATSGEIRLFGRRAQQRDYQRVGIQFQHTALPDFLTVRETLQLFAAFYPQPLAQTEVIELCALGDFIDRDTRRLSGGQRQRLLLALALINDPDLLFLDEPTTGLDPQSRRHFWSLIQAVKARGKTVVLTTHYMDEAQVLCDDIAIMDGGRIIEQGAPAQLLQQHFDGVMVSLPLASLANYGLPFATHQRETGVEIQTTQVDETVRHLSAAGVPLDGLTVSSPNLEDLFLKLTGHALRV